MNGVNLNVINNTNLSISILENGKGGDIEDSSDITVNKPNNIVNEPSNIVNEPSNVINKPIYIDKEVNDTNDVVVLNNDNYIKSLEIEGYEITFDKNVSNYSIEVLNDVDKLSFNILLNDDKATYMVSGNDNFKLGKNKVIITILAEDGSSRDYVIEVNKKELNKDNESLNDVKRTIDFIGLIGLIVFVSYLIYKLLKSDK